jgi:hypothetical protein
VDSNLHPEYELQNLLNSVKNSRPQAAVFL